MTRLASRTCQHPASMSSRASPSPLVFGAPLVTLVITLLGCAGPASAPPPLPAPILLPSVASSPAVPGRHSIGDRCAGDRALVCTEPRSALLCRNGLLAALPCRGPKGCVDSGDNSSCDDRLLDEGDVCRDRASPDDYPAAAITRRRSSATEGRLASPALAAAQSSARSRTGCAAVTTASPRWMILVPRNLATPTTLAPSTGP